MTKKETAKVICIHPGELPKGYWVIERADGKQLDACDSCGEWLDVGTTWDSAREARKAAKQLGVKIIN